MVAPHRSALLLAVVAASLAISTTACKSAADRAREKAEEKAIEQQTGGQVTIDDKQGTMTLVNDAGTVTMGAGAKIPADFPKSVPVYPGATTDLASRQSNPQGKPAWSLTLETGDAKDKVVAYYKANLADFKVASDMDMGEAHMSVWQNAQYDLTLMISEGSDKKTAITISVGGR
ncbi:MAG TPA: hypothetical protein VIF15_00670 [Polyangiaceae bacterium]